MATVIEKKSLNEIDKVRKITKFTRYFEKREKRKNTFLKYQDEIGAAIFFLSIFGMVGSSFLYIKGILSFWVVIPINAIFASFLHELEHDLIHGMYYKEKLMEKIMMYGVWIFRGNTPDPYYRKKIHLHHHKESGQFSDIEEQMIGNGMKYNFKRFLVMIDQQLSFFLNARRVAKTSPLKIKEMFQSGFPILVIFYSILYSFIFGNLLLFLNTNFELFPLPDFFTQILGVLNIIGVVYILPNLLRQASLQFISSTMHYFGDVNPGKAGVLEQTQVLNHPIFLPFQLFCFNFGSTHGIHHFVVNQPFYLRQMIAPKVHRVLLKYGVRFNDLGTFKRANRYKIA